MKYGKIKIVKGSQMLLKYVLVYYQYFGCGQIRVPQLAGYELVWQL